ncbi:MAG: hypothetical protein JSV89_17920 [Spirochaetaceae bacterium]|nr:MAG: hypothetical protein JSV89_17920 [Spirochaetaceae bacterium]
MKDNGIPDLFIEKLLLDELPKGMKEQLLKDPSVQRRLDELKAENRRILEEYPPEAMAEEIRRRSRETVQAVQPSAEIRQIESAPERERRSGAPVRRPAEGGAVRRWLSLSRIPRLSWPRLVPVAGFALLVLAGGLLLITRGPSFFAPQSPASEVRLKGGGAHLTVYMQTDTGARVLQEGDRVAEGATLQVSYVAGTNKYGAIISIDGRGTVTPHFPLSAMTGQTLEMGGEVLLPFAYTLDDAPVFERFFFVFSKRPFSLEKVLQAAEKLSEKPEIAKSQSLSLPRGVEQSSILLLK